MKLLYSICLVLVLFIIQVSSWPCSFKNEVIEEGETKSFGCEECTCKKSGLLVCSNAKCHGQQNDSCFKSCKPGVSLRCGSDNVTYYNECIFQNTKCVKPDLELAHLGACDGSSSKLLEKLSQ